MDRDRIVERRAERVAGLAQNLGVAHEAKGARPRHVRCVLARRPVEDHALAADDLAVEVDLEVEQAPIVGLERRRRVVVAHQDLAHDLDVAARLALDLEAHLEDALDERGGAAVDDRAFRPSDRQQGIVDAKAAQGRDHVLDRGDRNAVAEVDRRAQRRARHAREMHGNRPDDGPVVELALNAVAAVDRRRLDRQGDRLAPSARQNH